MSGLGDKGKWAEKQVQAWLDQAAALHWEFAYHRFPDARAARGALSAQPSDFLVARNGASLLEVKETANPQRLPKSKIGQYGKLKMFYEAGVPVYIVIYMSELMAWTYLDGEDLFIYEDCPPSYSLAGRPTYPTAASVLTQIYYL